MNLRRDQHWERWFGYNRVYAKGVVKTYPGPGTYELIRGRIYDRLQMIVGGPNPYVGSILQTQALRTINA